MAEFLEGYGVGDARRARIFWRLVIAGLVVLTVSLTLYFVLRSWPAKRQVQQFVDLLREKDYQAAYRLWGCTEFSPCREYTLGKFMEDWGPSGLHADAASMSIQRTRYCGPGVIVTLQSSQGDEVHLWYERRDSTIGFAPWPVCAPQPRAYQ